MGTAHWADGRSLQEKEDAPETPVPPPRGLLPSSLLLLDVRPHPLVLEALRFSTSSPQQGLPPPSPGMPGLLAVPGSPWDS